MINDPTTEQLSDASPSVFDAQKDDAKIAKQVLEAMQEDLSEDAPSWATENVEATVELVKEWRRQ